MKQFWSLILMILAGCLLIFGSEYSLQGDYHRRIHRLTVSKVVYHQNATSATISGRTKHGVIVTLKSGKHVRQVISNKQSGQFYVKMPVHKRITIKVVGLKAKVQTLLDYVETNSDLEGLYFLDIEYPCLLYTSPSPRDTR